MRPACSLHAARLAHAAATAHRHHNRAATTQALAEVGALLLLARSIEPVYGSTELVKLIALINLFSGGLTFVGVYLIYIASPARSAALL
jgi:hypothetical protein